MKRYLFILSVMACGAYSQASAQTTPPGREYIDQLCGCFSVNFRYAETFSPDENYKYHEREDMNGLELVLPIASSDKKVVMQHLLIVQDTMIIKHWREEWVYESPELLEYQGDRKWVSRKLSPEEIKNKWTQTVWEVSDEPRYQGISSWVANNGKVYWESTVDAPLPRREYTVRNDYNIMRRRNRIELKQDRAYIHEQDNDKISRKNNGEQLIVQEKGYNTYYRLDDSECAAAANWWKANNPFWTTVQGYWNHYLAGTQEVTLKNKVEDKMLYEHLFALWKEWSNKKVNNEELAVKVKEVISRFQ